MTEHTGWQYYKNALLPTCPPHEQADTAPIVNGELWRKGVLLARWTEDFDCPQKTEWWYVIKDTPFDIMGCNSNTRYKINKGSKRFRVEQIDPAAHIEDIYQVQVAAYGQYPSKYRPTVDKEKLTQSILGWDKEKVFVYAAYFRETDAFAGYILLSKNGDCLELTAQKVKPEYEKHQINAALVYHVLQQWHSFLEGEGYICDGARNIQHETAFQDYLEQYFHFRKAYCRLCIAYPPKLAWAVGLLYGFRGILKRLDGIGIVHKINGVLQMEQIVRKDRG